MAALVALSGLYHLAFGSARPPASFFVMQLADPQLGIKNGGNHNVTVALDWTAEAMMLQQAVHEINRLQPRFVVLSGDMQNWWGSNLPATDSRPAQNGVLGPESGLGDVGLRQTEDVKAALARLRPEVKVRAVMPGNHELGDTVSGRALAQYSERWGPSYYAFREEGVLFVVLNSQLYFDVSDSGDMAAERAAQTRWFMRELQRAQKDTSLHGMVLLTHIPPFIGDPEEVHGWANWPRQVRDALLGAATDPALRVRPRLVVCGHFHGNVQTSTFAYGARPLEVVTTSAVGCPMLWNGKASGEYTPAEASRIASAATGSVAFFDHIMRTHGLGNPDPSLIAERVDARPDRSGVRIFEFSSQGYRHRWFSLNQLAQVTALDEGLMFATPMTLFHGQLASA